MGRTLEEKRNIKNSNQRKKSRKKQSPAKIIFNCFIQSIIYSIVLYLFGISTLCIGSLNPEQFQKIFPKFTDSEKMDENNVKCPEKSTHNTTTHSHDHSHFGKKTGGGSKTRRRQRGGAEEAAAGVKKSLLNKKFEKMNEYIFCGGISYDNRYNATNDSINDPNKTGMLQNDFFKWARLYRWKLANSLTNSFWYGPFKWVTSYFKWLGLLGKTLYQNDFVKKLSVTTIEKAEKEQPSNFIDKAKILGGIIAGGFLALFLIIGIFCLGVGSMFYTGFKGALSSKNFLRGWGSLGILFNPAIWFGIMALGPITSTVYTVLSIFGGVYFKRKVLLKLLFSNLLLLFAMFSIIFLAKLSVTGVTDTVWVAAFIAPFIAVAINYKKILALLKSKKN